jgi:hypothetical protein
MSFASVYPMYLAKVEKKGRTKEELDQVIGWLTGFDNKKLQELIKENVTFEAVFVIEKDGSLSNIKINDNADRSIAREIKRLIASSPKWSPGIVSGKPVRVNCSIFLTFGIK